MQAAIKVKKGAAIFSKISLKVSKGFSKENI
jgi:hypothetical protein